MNERSGRHLGGLDIELARRIDVACRRFEADWRVGARPAVDDYLAEVPAEGRAGLRAELEALDRELRGAGETIVPPMSHSPAEAPTIAPASSPTAPIPGLARPSVHEEATMAPGDPATVDLGSDGRPSPDPAGPGRVRYFGDHEITRELARGGMGVVFLARQMSLNRPVALKMILAGQLADDIDVKRFYTEAEAAANLDHPGIVPIYEVGQHEGQHYFSMGFVEGQSLSQRLVDGPLPPREAAALMVKVAEAIDYAHRRDVIHRDLKPGNILLEKNGNPRVTDFGLAKRLQSDSGLTGSGQIMGTPSYMPPEQAGGNRGEVGPAADVYALGATLYALLTGRPPFQAATAMDTVLQVIGEEAVPPRRLNPSIPRDLETICLKCLQKEPGKRYAAAATLGEELGRYLAGEPIVARPVTRLERAAKWARRRPAVAGLLGLVVLVTALGLGGVLWQWQRAVQARDLAYVREQDALKAQAREREQAELAKRQTELAEQRLYDVRMNIVQRYWEDYDGALFQQGLDEQLPANQGGTDRRSFEWFYWRRKSSSGYVTLKGQAGRIRCLAFSPDGLHVAAAGDRTVKVWDATTGREIRTLEGHTSTVNGVAFSPDGRHLATSGDDCTVKVWDAANGQVTRTIVVDHVLGLTSVAFSPDGRRLATTASDGTVKVWDAADGRETLAFTPSIRGQIQSVSFSPDGRRLAAAGSDRTVKVWDAANGKEVLTFKGHSHMVQSAAFSPDGKRLASAGWDAAVKVWDAATGKEIFNLKGHTKPIQGVTFSRDGRRIASAGMDEVVKVWDAATGSEILTLKGHTGGVSSVAFSSDGHHLASGGPELKVWDAANGQEDRTLKGHAGPVWGVRFSRDGRWIASASLDRTVKVWDAATGKEIHTLKGHGGAVARVAFGPDGKWLISAGGDQTLKVWDAATGKEIRTRRGIAVNGDCVAFSPDGVRFGSVGFDGTVTVWDAVAGQMIRKLTGHARADIGGVAFSPDGGRLACVGGDETVMVWDIATGQETLTLKGHGSPVMSVAFSPDGNRLASACFDGTMELRDAATGQFIRTFKGHTGSIGRVVFSPDGNRLASAGAGGTLTSWDAATGQATLSLKGHDGEIMEVAFSPDGHRIVTAGQDGTVKIRDARPMDPEPANPGPNSR